MRSLLRLLPYFKKHKGKYLWGIFFVVVSGLAEAIAPHYVGRAITSLQKGTATSDTLMIDALFIVGLAAISGYLFYLVRQNIIVASREIEYDLRNDFLAHIQGLSMRFFQNTPPGEVMAYASNDMNAVRNFLGPAVMYSANTITTFVFALVFMLMISPFITLLVLTPLPLMSLGIYLVGKRVAPLADDVQTHYGTLTARSTESISGMKVVKAYVREKYEETIFDKLSDEYYKKNMKLVKLQGLMMPIIFGFVGLSVIILLMLAAPRIISGTMTLGDITQFVIYLGLLTWPFIALGWVTNMIQRSASSMKRLNDIFDMRSDIIETETVITPKEINGEIEFRNVSFRYRDDLPYILHNVSLTIPRGKTLAIVGKTGAGKTTLIDLIPRLYDPNAGEIFLDGHNIKLLSLEQLRGSIGMVTQESFLFSESLGENIAYGIDNVEQAYIAEAASSAHIHTDIADFPMQFETVVGERGITLSGGQKQRTSLARAIARNPKILILDDAMSAVDTHTEERILTNLRKVMKGRTSIIISHRVSTVKDADEIVVIDGGTITERGTHEELLAHRGWYYDLYQKQLLEEALELA